MTPEIKNVLIFILMIAVGVVLEVVASRIYSILTHKTLRKVHFSLIRYLFLMISPFSIIWLFSMKLDIPLLHIFIIFSLAGTFLEWLVGYSYHQIVGQRLWTYHRYSLNGYTSILSIPLWGLGGVLFWLLGHAFI